MYFEMFLKLLLCGEFVRAAWLLQLCARMKLQQWYEMWATNVWIA